jgi:hypothetical protein
MPPRIGQENAGAQIQAWSAGKHGYSGLEFSDLLGDISDIGHAAHG